MPFNQTDAAFITLAAHDNTDTIDAVDEDTLNIVASADLDRKYDLKLEAQDELVKRGLKHDNKQTVLVNTDIGTLVACSTKPAGNIDCIQINLIDDDGTITPITAVEYNKEAKRLCVLTWPNDAVTNKVEVI